MNSAYSTENKYKVSGYIGSMIHVHKQSLQVPPGNPSASFLSYKILPFNDYQTIVCA